MQYYAAAMLVMFLLYNITVGAKSVVTEQRTETLARLFSTPTSSFSILFGKFLGTLLFACIQFGIFIVATHFMFHVEWVEAAHENAQRFYDKCEKPRITDNFLG